MAATPRNQMINISALPFSGLSSNSLDSYVEFGVTFFVDFAADSFELADGELFVDGETVELVDAVPPRFTFIIVVLESPTDVVTFISILLFWSCPSAIFRTIIFVVINSF